MADPTSPLAGVPIFADLSPDELAAIAALVEEVDFPTSYPLMIQGIPAEEMAIIIEGSVVARRDDTVVATLGPGDVIGEIALLARRRRTASVITTSPSKLWVLEADAFRRVMDEHPSVAVKVLRIVADRLAALDPDA